MCLRWFWSTEGGKEKREGKGERKRGRRGAKIRKEVDEEREGKTRNVFMNHYIDQVWLYFFAAMVRSHGLRKFTFS